MNCRLVKKKVTFERDGKRLSFTNFYLVFDNGVILPVEIKYYTTKSTDKKDVENINKLNADNYAKFSVLADLLEDENK